ncbi:glycoside hydrolase family 10 protein [Hypholoma sublateritium FD-334 SS-4]|uniref:Beta-xylanase n=1 Tax=Hypholoma sublateritium (strain FD-334 SS-4) TaxID=945553 RepID=A0A0D2LUJ2_HYPSF|nr:glycoside hydrolase family 10 protein [Hypholoma sublateritium FD-334 SS-4]
MTLKLAVLFVGLLAHAKFAAAQSAAWGQCGGENWTGATTCVAGWVCTYSNPYYSQCLQSSSGSATATSTSSTATSSATLPTGTSNAGIALVAKAAGKKYFGSATDNPELTDTAYVAILSNSSEFGQITPGNSMKWDATEPSQGTFTFAAGDVIADLAIGNGQLLRGHNCVWYNQLPSWVTSGNFDNATLQSIVKTHCSTVVSHYAGKIWDVINEPFNDDGTWRADVFYNTIGPLYVNTALIAARAADPNAKLYINDYNIEGTGAKSTAMVNLVKSLQAAGVPIDGVGIQGHLIVGEVPSTLIANMEQFTALGIEVAITELDIRMTLPATPALYAQQKQDYETVISACNSVPGCIGVTIWDYTDKYSWVPSTFSGQGAACPWDATLVKKPAYDGIVAGFQS